MANITIPNLPQAIALTGTEQLLGVQSGTSKSITISQISTYITAGTILPVANGGTGNFTFDNYGILYGDGTNPVESITPPTGSNYILVASPGTIPAWQENIPVTAGVNSISFGSTGLTPNTATEGIVTVAGTLVAANGGTGQSSFAVGDLLYANTTTTLAKLADVATGSVLISGGVGVAPFYSASPTLTTSLTTPLLIGGTTASSTLTLKSTSGVGTSDSILFKVGSNGATTAITISSAGVVSLNTALAVGSGGTGATTFTANGVIYGNTTSALGVTAAGTTGQVLVATTSGAPSWGAIPSTAAVTSITFGTTGLTPNTATTGAVTVAGTLVAANGGTGQSSYAVGDLLYASTTTALAKLADVATGSVLVSGGVGVAPSYSASPTLTTSLTTPLLVGGTGVGSSLTLQSTSGVGTSDSIAFKVGNNGATTAMTANTSGNIEFRAGTAALPALTTTGDTNTGIFFPAADTMAFTEGGAEAMRINSSGNVGIGTTTPAEPLSVVGQISTSGAVGGFLLRDRATNASSSQWYSPTAGNTRLFDTVAAADRLVIDANGNVGIGTTSLINVNLRVSKGITGSTSAYGVYEDGAIQSDVTSIGAYYVSAGSMASGTLSNLFHYYATQGTIGATVSAQIGFISSDGLIGATNNYGFAALNTAAVTAGKTAYGFYSAVNTATGGGTTYQFYAAGTAPSVINGTVTLGTPLAVSSGGTGATTANAGLTKLTTFTSTATATGTTVLTNTSTYFQFFTGTLTQTITLPVTSTLGTGWSFHIVNNSTGNLTVNSSGGNLVITVLPGTTVMCTCILTSGTTAASWEAGYTDFSTATGTGSVVLATSPTVNNPTVTNYVESVVAIGTVTTASTLALTNGTVQTATLTASTACTFTMPAIVAGKSFTLLLKQAAATGNGTATFTSVKWSSSGAPTITAAAGKMDILSFISDGTNWYGSIIQGYTP